MEKDMLENIEEIIGVQETKEVEQPAETKPEAESINEDVKTEEVETKTEVEEAVEKKEPVETVNDVVIKEVKSLQDALAVLTQKITENEGKLESVKAEVAKLFFNPQDARQENKKMDISELLDSGIIDNIL